MTAFDLFQDATCDIASGNRRAAFLSLTAAIKVIDKNGIDAHMRPELVALRNALIEAAQ